MEKEIQIRYNEETGAREKYEPYMTIDCMTKEDFQRLEIAIEKQKAKKPKFIPSPVDRDYFDCPYCEKTMEKKQYAYCPDCGQKLDWSKYDES